jgi:7-cyano-7-deazaguanine synthase
MKCIVLLSGGMDSSCALATAIHEGHDVVECLSFEYGAKHNDREWEAAQKVAAYYGVPVRRISLPFIAELFASDLLKSGGDIPEGHYADESMRSTVVPFRNGIMLSIAAGYAESRGAECVVLANHFGDHAIYPDCRRDFIEPMGHAIHNGTYAKIKIAAPFAGMTKGEIAVQGTYVQVPFELTWSCYKGGTKHCGVCGTCVERKEAFQEASITDPTEYHQ